MQQQNLASYRKALQLLGGLHLSDQRRSESRYTPAGPLSTARVSVASRGQDVRDADVVDLSHSGMRLAVAPGLECCEGDVCQIELMVASNEHLSLQGEVRWVQQHPWITVFGVLLDPTAASAPRA